MNYSSHDIADILKRLDHTDIGSSEEAISTSLLRSCLEQIPDLSQTLLAGIVADSWRSGGHHHGDLVGRRSDQVAVHVEIKGPRSYVNRSKSSCKRTNCLGPGLLQFEHMLEDGVPVILLTSPDAGSLRWLARHTPDLLQRLRVMHWAEAAGAIRSLPPVHFDPLKSMLGV